MALMVQPAETDPSHLEAAAQLDGPAVKLLTSCWSISRRGVHSRVDLVLEHCGRVEDLVLP